MDSTQQPNITTEQVTSLLARIRESTKGTKFNSNTQFMFQMVREYVKEANRNPEGRFAWLAKTGLTPKNIEDLFQAKSISVRNSSYEKPEYEKVDVYPDVHIFDSNGKCTTCTGDEFIPMSDEARAKANVSLMEDEYEGKPPSINIEDVLDVETFEVKLQVECEDNESEKFVSVRAYYLQLLGKEVPTDKTLNDWMEDIIEHNQARLDAANEVVEKMEEAKATANQRRKKRERIKKKAKGK